MSATGRPEGEYPRAQHEPTPGRVLRVRFIAQATAESRQDWALYDGAGALLSNGRDPPARWPGAARAEAVLDARRVRVVALRLPPLPAARLRPAAAFAVEDQLAGVPDDQHVAVSGQAADGTVRIVIVERDLLRTIVAMPGPGFPAWSRVVAEPELLPAAEDWHWCADDATPGHAFLRFPDGTAMATAAPPPDGALPDELLRLLATKPVPATIAVRAAATEACLASWSAATGVRFVAQPPWRWQESGPAAFAAATDVLQGDFAPAAAPGSGRRWPAWRSAVALGLAAVGLHVTATLGEWAWLHYDAQRDAAAWRSLAANAGVAGSSAGADPARVAIERRFSDLRHANGLPAPGDALPVLARAAPALARLPRGALKSASFTAGAWTVELGPVEPETLREFDAAMKEAGLPALIARTASGTRARFGGSAS